MRLVNASWYLGKQTISPVLVCNFEELSLRYVGKVHGKFKKCFHLRVSRSFFNGFRSRHLVQESITFYHYISCDDIPVNCKPISKISYARDESDFQFGIRYQAVKLKAEILMDYWTAVLFCLELFGRASLVEIEPVFSQLRCQLL